MNNKFVVNEVKTDNYPYVVRSVGCPTMEEAVDVAVKIVVDSEDSEDEIREELNADGFYIPTKHADWSVCINEVIEYQPKEE